MHCAPGGGLSRDKLFQLDGKFHRDCAVREIRVRVYNGRCLGGMGPAAQCCSRFASAPPRWYHGRDEHRCLGSTTASGTLPGVISLRRNSVLGCAPTGINCALLVICNPNPDKNPLPPAEMLRFVTCLFSRWYDTAKAVITTPQAMVV